MWGTLLSIAALAALPLSPAPGAADGAMRVLLTYREGGGASERYSFPELSLVPLGGEVEVLSGRGRASLRPVVTLFPGKPILLRPQGEGGVLLFEGLRFELGPHLLLRPADPARPVLFHLPQRPPYPGWLWLEARPGGFWVVNQVGLEEYLRRVLPSEMPVHFHPEALKAQAVVARTYALARRQADSFWKRWWADVDDSVSEQAYNRTATHPASDAAVEATRGQVLTFRGAPIQSFFFSTSPGFTASIEEVWPERPATPYLRARPQAQPPSAAIRSEAQAVAFFQNWNPRGFYDAASPFWRWRLSLSREELESLLARTLLERARVAPQFVQTLEGPLSPGAPGFALGRLLQLRAAARSPGGYVTELEVRTSTGRYRVRRESNIRHLLRPDKALTGGGDVVLERWQGGPRLNFPLLPSAAFAIQEERDARGELQRVVLWGGGFGHGVGMSQFGALGLAQQGQNYRRILEHFYPGARLEVLRYATVASSAWGW
ncbi:SpoIID/LytB domain-containing protein [Meiothermus sp. QL-1]|uniref:SpoIID/LytB domain-containing protein n=1 Tax=Meiothermus sp. QL-1 TaxID=2058095 RepID=UPI001F1AB2AD|nr:SpoIID/LytB domain-containing protein [Meiothermus sp. QL-1]